MQPSENARSHLFTSKAALAAPKPMNDAAPPLSSLPRYPRGVTKPYFVKPQVCTCLRSEKAHMAWLNTI